MHSVEGREHLRITFPKLDGYRLEIPDDELHFDAATAAMFEIGPSTVPTWTQSAGIVGTSEEIQDRGVANIREQQIAFALARRLVDGPYYNIGGENPRPWLFPRLVAICMEWLRVCVQVHEGFSIGYMLRYAEWQAEAAEAVRQAITVYDGHRRERMRPILRRFDPVGSTASVSFSTRKATVETDKSEVSHVTLDGSGGNTWEQILALECERAASRVAAFVKNDHLGLAIPYVHKGSTHAYLPDFLLRLERAPGENFDRILIVEVSGGQKSPGPTVTIQLLPV